jgi:hypothetical protein
LHATEDKVADAGDEKINSQPHCNHNQGHAAHDPPGSLRRFHSAVLHVGVRSDAKPKVFVLITIVPGALFLDVGQTARLISA